MLPEDIMKLTRAQPYQPFRVTLTNGEEFDIRHPDMIMPASFGLVYLARPPKNGAPNVVQAALDHILKIEYLTSDARSPVDKSTV